MHTHLAPTSKDSCIVFQDSLYSVSYSVAGISMQSRTALLADDAAHLSKHCFSACMLSLAAALFAEDISLI